MYCLPQHTQQKPSGPIRSLRSAAGFTLLEVMLASMVLVAAGLGIYDVMIHAYRVASMTRYRDDARAVLQTFASQFGQLQTSDLVAGTSVNRILFQTGNSPTGQGLLWDSSMGSSTGNNLTLDMLSNEPASAGAHTAASGLTVMIGGSQNGIPATVTRYVLQVKDDGTTTSTTLPPTSAGQMFVATFTITYPIIDATHPTAIQFPQQTQQITVMRTAP